MQNKRISPKASKQSNINPNKYSQKNVTRGVAILKKQDPSKVEMTEQKLPSSLPKALPDYRKSPAQWESLQKLLNQFSDMKPEENAKSSNMSIPPSENLIRSMSRACTLHSASKIHQLYNENKHLIVTPHPVSKQLPLIGALQSAENVMAVIESLEKYQEGLGLASLLHPTVLGHLPLDHALRYRKSTLAILKIMAWMGDSLNDFKLSSRLPALSQDKLNTILFASIMLKNEVWIDKAISWGANKDATFIMEMADYQCIMALVDPGLKKNLNRESCDIF